MCNGRLFMKKAENLQRSALLVVILDNALLHSRGVLLDFEGCSAKDWRIDYVTFAT